MDRQQDVELLQEYAVAFLEQGKPAIGLTLLMFAGRISLQEQYQGFNEGGESE